MTDVTSLGNTSAEITTNFMTLLVTELQHQNPLEPMKNEELTQQLAILSQLQEMEELHTDFKSLMHGVQVGELNQLMGRVVHFVPDELGEEIAGVLTGVKVENGIPKGQVGPYEVAIEDIIAVEPYYDTGTGGGGGGEPTNGLAGDLNQDGVVNDSDRDIMLENWGVTSGASIFQGDLTGDGAVDHHDYQILMEHYGQSLDGSTGGTTDTHQ